MTSSLPPPDGPPTKEEPDIAGIVLAGGGSTRMGRDKATIRFGDGGETLLERAARTLTEAGATTIVVATGKAGRLGEIPWDVVDDGEFAGHGPLAGLAAAFEATSGSDTALVLAVDLPFARAPLLRWLANERHVTGVPGVIPVDPTEQRPQPLHAAYRPAAVAPAIRRALTDGERRVLRVLAAAGAVQVTVDPVGPGEPPWHRNANRPLDLRPQPRTE